MKDPFIRMELIDPSKNNLKYYELWIEPAGQLPGGIAGFVVNFRHGRIGSNTKVKTKTDVPTSYAAASRIYREVRDEKLGKGYVEIDNAKPAETKCKCHPNGMRWAGCPIHGGVKPGAAKKPPDDDPPPEKRYRSIVL